jgi:hypothetical protein
MIKALFFLITILACFSALPAQAGETHDNFIISIENTSPATPPKSVPCSRKQKQCFLSILSEDGAGPIDIAVSLQGGEARFQFMQDRRYLPIRNNGQNLLIFPLNGDSAETKVDLFDPGSLEPADLIQRPVLKTGRVVARLILNIRSARD